MMIIQAWPEPRKGPELETLLKAETKTKVKKTKITYKTVTHTLHVPPPSREVAGKRHNSFTDAF